MLDVLSCKLKEARKITVFTGAGISTAAGVPDFRSPGGLYDILGKEFTLPYPEAIFDIDFFTKNPGLFYQFSKKLLHQNIEPTNTHKFLSKLEAEGRISVIVTQNIDRLHEKAGSKKLINCHGTYQTAHCLSCHKEFMFKDFKENIQTGKVKYCSCSGLVKPDIIFFGESLPQEFYSLLENPPKTDLLLVLGTSLTVYPAASFPIQLMQEHNPFSIIINKEPGPYDQHFSLCINDDLESIFSALLKKQL